ncbi:MAG: alpha-L-fucosidase [Anaerolineaceae bacterium]|nr:alpha-L-fucosidase [Anaerolineaceae bacterium]
MTDETQLPDDSRRMAWYLDAKFGMFIHWGIYAAAGVEASWPIMAPDLSEAMFRTSTRISESDYTALAQRFNPVEFNAEVWVRTAQAAGMRYMIFTAKHHDGFCMFDAPGTDYKITNTPFGRDVCAELADACAAAGMPLGFYYSPPDMHHPGYRDTSKPAARNWLGEPTRPQWAEYLDYMESHIRHLLTNYGDVRILWFDGLVNHAKYDPPRFHRLIHEISPNTLINDRLGGGYDYITPEQFIPKKGVPVRTGLPPSGNDASGELLFRAVTFLFKVPLMRGYLRGQLQKYGDGELELSPVPQEPYPAPDRFQPWETCMTTGNSWAYNPLEADWKSIQQLTRNLVEVVSRGGNLLLNVGPDETGAFPANALVRLARVGRWLKLNQEAIYGSVYTPLGARAWGRTTRKNNQLYLHVFDWPEDQRLVIDAFPGAADRARLAVSGELLTCHLEDERLVIELPEQAPDADVSVLAVEIDEDEVVWSDYSSPVPTGPEPKQYLRSQAAVSGWINLILNGLIAFFAYRGRGWISFGEAAVDILITVAIISFLVSWIAIGSARQKFPTHAEQPARNNRRRLPLPNNAVLRALLITAASVLVFGGLLLCGSIYLISPGGLDHWVYFGVKTLYTGVCAALTAGIAIWSVLKEAAPR